MSFAREPLRVYLRLDAGELSLQGVGMRHVGDDVHCFDCEEKVIVCIIFSLLSSESPRGSRKHAPLRYYGLCRAAFRRRQAQSAGPLAARSVRHLTPTIPIETN